MKKMENSDFKRYIYNCYNYMKKMTIFAGDEISDSENHQEYNKQKLHCIYM